VGRASARQESWSIVWKTLRIKEDAMSYNELRKGRVSEPEREYLVTWVTRDRRPVFRDFWAARGLVRALRQSESEGAGMWLAWVVMPDHFHGLLRLRSDGPTLSKVVGRIKGRSARALGARNGGQGRGILWQPGFHDHALRAEEQRIAVARYIVANPIRAGLVTRLEDYPHWDSVWL
jgi:REP element-mobilizing transposase RayT